MTPRRYMTRAVIFAGVSGSILVEVVLFCVGSLGAALGLSFIQLILVFLFESLVPLILGVTGAWLVVAFRFSNPERVAFVVGLLGTAISPVLAFTFQLDQRIPQSTALVRIASVLLFMLSSGILFQFAICGMLRGISHLSHYRN